MSVGEADDYEGGDLFSSSKNRRVSHIQTSTFAIVNTVKKTVDQRF